MAAERPPAGLKASGKALWTAVMAAYELLPDERQALLAACKTVDELGRLEAALAKAPATTAGSKGQVRPHPLFAEVRAHRLALRALLAAVGITEGEADRFAGAARSHAGRSLARQRWGGRGAA